MRLGIDIDGTIRDIYTPLRNTILDLSPPTVTVDPIDEWTNYEIWNHVHGLSEEEVKRIWFSAAVNRIYYREANVYPNALLTLRKLYEIHKIIYISAQPNLQTIEATLDWFRKCGINYHELHFTEYQTKHLIDCDIYIEDSPGQNEMLAAEGKECFLIKRPWNDGQWNWENIETAFSHL